MRWLFSWFVVSGFLMHCTPADVGTCLISEDCGDITLLHCHDGVCLPRNDCSSDANCQESTSPLCETGKCMECLGAGTPDAKLLQQVPLPGTKLKSGEMFAAKWKLQNTGSAAWSAPCGYLLEYRSGSDLGPAKTKTLADLERIPPQETKEWVVDLAAPTLAGKYTSLWQMSHNGSVFGNQLLLDIEVVQCQLDTDCPNPAYPICIDGECRVEECNDVKPCMDAARPDCKSGRCVAGNTCGAGSKPTAYTWSCPNTLRICNGFKVPNTYQTCLFHTGIDVCGSTGDPILAVADGLVVHVGYMWYNGQSTGRGPYAIIVQHSENFYSTYGHNESALVATGECVVKGQKIATMGSRGYSYGPHLHFEIVEGVPFTGEWQTPFNDVCSHYQDPNDYISP